MPPSILEEYQLFSYTKLNKKFLKDCVKGNLKIIKEVLNDENLRHKIDFYFKDDSGENALDNACFSGNLELVKFLIEYESSLSNNELPLKLNNALMVAGEFEHLAIVKYILESPNLSKHINPSYDEHEFINSICYNKNKLILDYLLNNKTSLVKYDVKNITDGISYTCDNDSYDIISCILNKTKNKDRIFELIFESRNNGNILEYVICNYGIEKTPFIENLIKHDEKVLRMFSKQDLHNELKAIHINETKPVKKNKVKI